MHVLAEVLCKTTSDQDDDDMIFIAQTEYDV